MAAENEAGFLIDGVLYEVPSLETFNMDELQVLYDYAGIGLEDFAQSPDESEEEARERSRMFKNPGLWRALMHVAYQRKHPKMPMAQVRKLVGTARGIDVLAGMAAEPEPEEEQQIPLASTSEPSGSSSSGSLEKPSSTPPSNGSGGSVSTRSSDEPDVLRAATIASRSATSSISPQEISAA